MSLIVFWQRILELTIVSSCLVGQNTPHNQIL
jgi:hypothetical protein